MPLAATHARQTTYIVEMMERLGIDPGVARFRAWA